MPQYYGYSSINANKPKTTNATSGVDGGPGGIRQPIYWGKKFTLVDEQLVIQDFINAFNIKQGTKVGKPGYGTIMWDFVFEPNTADMVLAVQTEVRRVASADPRIQIANISVYTRENGILIELEMAVAPFNQAQLVSVFLNQQTGTAGPL
jgi:phage baseplate assembly protein W